MKKKYEDNIFELLKNSLKKNDLNANFIYGIMNFYSKEVDNIDKSYFKIVKQCDVSIKHIKPDFENMEITFDIELSKETYDSICDYSYIMIQFNLFCCFNKFLSKDEFEKLYNAKCKYNIVRYSIDNGNIVRELYYQTIETTEESIIELVKKYNDIFEPDRAHYHQWFDYNISTEQF